MHNLVTRFASAGLDLRLASVPFTNNPDIFSLDIRRARAHDVRSEHFIGWLGKEDNTVQVQAADKAERQVVLFVREARRSFAETVPESMMHRITSPVGSFTWRRIVAQRVGVEPRALVVRADGSVVVQRTTSGGGRHLLVGCDERQLFMCELPKPCTSIKQAHEALRPKSLPKNEKVIRQGEWFFVPVSDFTPDVIHRNTAINRFIPRAGKPHIVDEIGIADGIYARGGVRHPDHKTIKLRGWHRVVKNLEVVQNRSILGGTWID
jgi:hypothetical protein